MQEDGVKSTSLVQNLSGTCLRKIRGAPSNCQRKEEMEKESVSNVIKSPKQKHNTQ